MRQMKRFGFVLAAMAAIILTGCGGGSNGLPSAGIPVPSGANTGASVTTALPTTGNAQVLSDAELNTAFSNASRGAGAESLGTTVFLEMRDGAGDVLPTIGQHHYVAPASQPISPGLGTEAGRNQGGPVETPSEAVEYIFYKDGTKITPHLVSNNPPVVTLGESGNYTAGALIRLNNERNMLLAAGDLSILDADKPALLNTCRIFSSETPGRQTVESEIHNLNPQVVSQDPVINAGIINGVLTVSVSGDRGQTVTRESLDTPGMRIAPGTTKVKYVTRNLEGWQDPGDLRSGVQLRDIGRETVMVRFDIEPEIVTPKGDIIRAWNVDVAKEGEGWYRTIAIKGGVRSAGRWILRWNSTEPIPALP